MATAIRSQKGVYVSRESSSLSWKFMGRNHVRGEACMFCEAEPGSCQREFATNWRYRMNRFVNPHQLAVAIGMFLTTIGSACNTSVLPGADAEARAVILDSPGGVSRFAVTGWTGDFGRYLAVGEAMLEPGDEDGVLLKGSGIAVLQAENEDHIVADVTCRVAEDGIDFTFHWRNSVTLSSGATVSNTGAFVNQQPPGLAILRSRSSLWGPINWCCRTCCGDQQCDTMITCCGPCVITSRGRVMAPSARRRTSKEDIAAQLTGVSEQRAMILETPDGLSHFAVTGITPDFGRYLALGEAALESGGAEGVVLDGLGIAALEAEDGDQIAADVTCKVADDGVDFTFHWRDSVTFSTGATVSNSGAFVNEQPPGLAIARSRSSLWGPIIRWCCRTCCADQQCDTTFTCCGPCTLARTAAVIVSDFDGTAPASPDSDANHND